MVMPDGTEVPSSQVTDQDLADVRGDLEHLARMATISLDALVELLYAASAHSDRSRIAAALDCLLDYLSYWSVASPERVAALFERLEPARLLRAVGQTLLASTRLAGDRSIARQEFLALFLDDDDTQTLCALCRHVAGRHSAAFRFRFAEWRPRFDLHTAEVVPPAIDDRYGFTCATFVLAMLRSAALEELLALDQWPVPAPNDADDRWQNRLVAMLCPTGASPEDLASVLAGIGARRVHPTDVAGGAMQPREDWPVSFVDARREGEQVDQRLM